MSRTTVRRVQPRSWIDKRERSDFWTRNVQTGRQLNTYIIQVGEDLRSTTRRALQVRCYFIVNLT